MGLLETSTAYHTSPNPVERIPAIAGKESGTQLRPNSRCELAWRRSNAKRGSCGKEVRAAPSAGRQHVMARTRKISENVPSCPRPFRLARDPGGIARGHTISKTATAPDLRR